MRFRWSTGPRPSQSRLPSFCPAISFQVDAWVKYRHDAERVTRPRPFQYFPAKNVFVYPTFSPTKSVSAFRAISGANPMNSGASIGNDCAWDGSNEAKPIKFTWADDGFRIRSAHPTAPVTRCRVLACKEDRTVDKRCCKMGHRTAGNSRW